MPVIKLLALTGPLLLFLLLALNAYMEPEKPIRSPGAIIVDNAYKDHTAAAGPLLEGEDAEYERLSRLPLLR